MATVDSYRLTKKLDSSKKSKKYIAIKYDIGTVRSDKYGEVSISGHFLLPTRHDEFPPVYEKETDEKSRRWLNEMGLQELREEVLDKMYLQYACCVTAPGVDPDKLEFYFKLMVFVFIYDDYVSKLKNENKNNPVKHIKDLATIIESLRPIIESGGDDKSTAAAVDKLDPAFKSSCIALSYLCRYGIKHMSNDDYKRIGRELMDFMLVNKWMQEYWNSSYTEEDYMFLRCWDGGPRLTLEAAYFAHGIHVSNEVRMHPLFQRFIDKATLHVCISNDIVSLRKELVNNEGGSLVFLKCQEHSLQKSILEVEKITNQILIDMKKIGMKLKSYFPSDNNLAKYIVVVENQIHGFVYWHFKANRYLGNCGFEEYEVEYDVDYDSWLENMSGKNVENLKEPILSESPAA